MDLFAEDFLLETGSEGSQDGVYVGPRLGRRLRGVLEQSWEVFWILGGKNVPKTAQDVAKTARDDAKVAQDGAKTCQDGKGGAKTGQEWPRRRETVKIAQDSAKTCRDGAKTGQDGTRTVPTQPKTVLASERSE